MKKYGLQLRIPPSQSKPAAARPPPPPPAFAFGGDDDDDVEKEISRQASKNKALKKVEEQYAKALKEDPSVFDYDGVYDEMKEKISRPKTQDRAERKSQGMQITLENFGTQKRLSLLDVFCEQSWRSLSQTPMGGSSGEFSAMGESLTEQCHVKSKYIEVLMDKAKEREREHEIVYERKLLKERSKEDHLFAEKEKFVTSAYKKKLAEQEKWLEEERLRQLREEKEDVTKKSDLSEFYFSLNKNVAFGARVEEGTKPRNHEQARESSQEAEASVSTSKAPARSPRKREEADTKPDSSDHGRKGSEEVVVTTTEVPTVANISSQDKKAAEPSATQITPEHYKRSDDALAAARERFLARKRAREQ